MATFSQIADLIVDPAFTKRLKVAVLFASHAVLTESEATTNHAARLRWAKAANTESNRWVDIMMPMIIANPTLQTELNAIDDGSIQFIINSLVDQFSTSPYVPGA